MIEKVLEIDEPSSSPLPVKVIYGDTSSPQIIYVAFSQNTDIMLARIDKLSDPIVKGTILSVVDNSCSSIELLDWIDESDSSYLNNLLLSLTCDSGTQIKLIQMTYAGLTIEQEYSILGTTSASAFTSTDNGDVYKLNRDATKLLISKSS